MRSRSARTIARGALAALALVAGAHPATADEEVEKKEIRIEKIVRCEDGDCTETVRELGEGEEIEISRAGGEGRRVIVREIECDGEDCPHHHGEHRMIFVGDDGEVEMLSGGGHRWMHGARAGGSYLGVGLTDLTPELRAHFGVTSDAGVMVSKVMDGSPAAEAGLAVGDIITATGGEAVASSSALAHRIRSLAAGEEVTLEVWRGGSSRSLTAAVAERPGERMAAAGGPTKMRRVIVRCEDGDADCEVDAGRGELEDFDCGAPDCRVTVECDNGDCTCQVNGEDADCSTIPGVPSR